MAKKDYVPLKDAQKIPWATNLKDKIATIGPTLGLSPGDVTDVQSACDVIIANINGIEAARQVFEHAATDKREQNLAQVRTIRTVVKRAKASATYTNGLGQELGIIGDEQTIDIANSKPKLTIRKEGGAYRIDFNLMGFFDGVNIYRNHPPDDPASSYLATDTGTPYIDNTPVNNGTVYYAYYVLNGMQVGQQSDLVTVTV